MDPKQITKQMIQFNKNAFDNSFKAMDMMSEQSEKMIDTMLSQATWMPEEGKKAIKDWVAAYRSGCTEFKKMVEDNYAKVEANFEKE